MRVPGEGPGLYPLCDLDEHSERDQLGDLSVQGPARRGAVGECLEGVRLCRPQGRSGLAVPRVELEELPRESLSDLDDLRSRFEATPGQFGERDEPDAGEDRVVGALIQGDEDAEPFDRRDRAGEDLQVTAATSEAPQSPKCVAANIRNTAGSTTTDGPGSPNAFARSVSSVSGVVRTPGTPNDSASAT